MACDLNIEVIAYLGNINSEMWIIQVSAYSSLASAGDKKDKIARVDWTNSPLPGGGVFLGTHDFIAGLAKETRHGMWEGKENIEGVFRRMHEE